MQRSRAWSSPLRSRFSKQAWDEIFESADGLVGAERLLQLRPESSNPLKNSLARKRENLIAVLLLMICA
ncbi:hypothetical protein EV14_2297 [Prochlorococcus sp. MIT 0703]|nr:hypothetical protein EV12_1439 [Prochlorococcus sp. MIT 0701]KGG31346.1 hypothetical protein EV14_2297 [Prochlorococcus sp. MIT 0703]